MGDELFHSGGQSDVKNLTAALPSFANAPQNDMKSTRRAEKEEEGLQ